MEKLTEEQYRLARAMKKIDDMKGYYMHVAAYILMNAFILIAWQVDDVFPESFYLTSIYIIAVWGGAGLLLHTILHFANIRLLGRKWEERKLRQFLEKNKGKDNPDTNQK